MKIISKLTKCALPVALLTAGAISASWCDDARAYTSLSTSDPFKWNNTSDVSSIGKDIELYKLTNSEPTVQQLIVTGNNKVSQKELENVQKLLPSVQDISFFNCPKLGSKHLLGWNNLRSIMFNGCPKIDDRTAAYIAFKYGWTLESIFVDGTKITMEGLKWIAEHCTNVKDVHIGNLLKNDGDLETILNAFNKMECLSLSGLKKTVSFNLDEVYRNVHFISLESCDVDDDAVVNMCARFPDSQVITFRGCPITDEAVTTIMQELNVECISFDDCKSITNKALSNIAMNLKSSLKRVCVKGATQITQEAAASLKSINIEFIPADTKINTSRSVNQNIENSDNGNFSNSKIENKEIEIKKNDNKK